MNWQLPPWLFRSALARMYARAVAAGNGVQARELITSEFQRVVDAILERAEKLPAEVKNATRATITEGQRLSAEIGDLDIAADSSDEELVRKWETFVFSEPLRGAAFRVSSLLRQAQESWTAAFGTAKEATLGLILDELVLTPLGKLASVNGLQPLLPRLPDPFTLAGLVAFAAAPVVLIRGRRNAGTIAAGLAAAGILATTAGARTYARGRALP